MSVGGFDVGGFVSDFAGDFADFATDFAADFTSDFGLDSFTDSFGSEFLTDIGGSFVDFGGDIFSGAGEFFGDIGGSLYEQVGSFAGNADWFNATSFGSILDSAGAGISEFFGDVTGSLSGITNYLPTSVNSITSALPSGLTNIPGVGSIVSGATNIGTNLLTTAARSIVPTGTALIGNAIGVNPALIGATLSGQLPSLGSIVTGTAGINPGIVPGIGGGGISLGSILGSAGIGSTAGYNTRTPGIVPTSGFNIGSSLNSALAFVTGSGSAQAQPRPTNTTLQFPDSAYGSTGILDIEITGVGINTGDTIAQDPTRAGSITGGFVESFTGLNVLPGELSTDTGSDFQQIYNPDTGSWDVYNTVTNQTIASGLTEQEAILASQEYSISENVLELNVLPQGQQDEFIEVDGINILRSEAEAVDQNQSDDLVLLNDTATGANNPTGAGINLGNLLNNAAGTAAGIIQQARQQQTVRDQRQNRAQAGDWRVRLRLAPNSNYLYNDPQCGPVLWPLRNTDGVIFPYTPNIDTAYKAEYDAYNLTHSNYRGYFYKGSYVDAVNIKAMFTAQDTSEANYLLAVIHFFRSATKMFYGQDAQRGAPPPLVYLSGLGDYQFAEHPCAISQFNYTLPSDVDYIRAQSGSSNGTNRQIQRDRQTIAGNPLSYALQRLATVGLTKGALPDRLASGTLGLDNPTYVPTKMDINLTLFPIQSREQVSKQFSVKNFANGNLLKGGFW
jgi:hypothetical protein